MTDTVEVKFKCPRCGGRIVWAENAADSDNATCEACGEEIENVGLLKKRAVEEVKKAALKKAKDIFRRR